MEWFFNPWVISFIIIAVIVSNICALKYTAYMKIGQQKKKTPTQPQDDSSPSTHSQQDPKDHQ